VSAADGHVGRRMGTDTRQLRKRIDWVSTTIGIVGGLAVVVAANLGGMTSLPAQVLCFPCYVGFGVFWFAGGSVVASHLIMGLASCLAWLSASELVLMSANGPSRFSRMRFYGFALLFITLWALGGVIAVALCH
jgi:hypothetical protein